MTAFLLRRILSGLLLVFALTFLTFFVFNEIPTNPACLVVACGPHTTTTDADIRAADHRLGIDRPVYVQYGKFVWHLVRHADFGTAWTSQQRVGTLIGQALPVTASLVGGGMLLMLLLALPLGCIAALRPRSPADRGLLAASVIGLAIHPFVLGITLQQFFSKQLHVSDFGYCPLKRPPAVTSFPGGVVAQSLRRARRLGQPPGGAVARVRALLPAGLHAHGPRSAARDAQRAVRHDRAGEGRLGDARRRRARAAKCDRPGAADARGRRGHRDHGGDLCRDGLRPAGNRLAGRQRVQRRAGWVRPALDRGHRHRRRRVRRPTERRRRRRRCLARSTHPDDDGEWVDPAAAGGRHPPDASASA